MDMRIIVLAERFEAGVWKDWEHTCGEEEVDAVIDSANAKARDQLQSKPSYIDYLKGAAYLFDVAYGSRENPRDGDTQVYGVIVDEVVIGNREKVQRHRLLKDLVH